MNDRVWVLYYNDYADTHILGIYRTKDEAENARSKCREGHEFEVFDWILGEDADAQFNRRKTDET